MRAIVVAQPGRVEIVELQTPAPGPYQALVKVDVAALCNATDGKLVAGHFPGVDTYPLVLGHESTGKVVAVGDKVRTFHIGDRAIGGMQFEFSPAGYASGWGAFCDFNLVNDHDAMVADGVADAEHGWFECYEIQRATDADIPAEEAVLMCTWREVLGAFGDFHLAAGDDILIFGAGPVGLSFVKFAKFMGLGWVGVVDPVESKWQRAKAMGADETFLPGEARLAELTRRRGKPLDAVIDAVGNVACANAGLPLIKMGGSICVYGVIAAPTLDIQKSLGPYNFNLFVHQWPTRSRERAAQAQLSQWIREGKLTAKEFVTHEFPFDKITEALDTVKTGQSVKTLLRL